MPEQEKESTKLELVKLIGQRGDLTNCLFHCETSQQLYFALKRSLVAQNVGKNASNLPPQLFSVDVQSISSFKFLDECGGLFAVGEFGAQGSYAKVLVLKKVEDGHGDRLEECLEYKLHLSAVKTVDLSLDGRLVASLGGEDDGNVVVMDIANKKLIGKCSAQQARSGASKCLQFSNKDPTLFVTAGNDTVRIWKVKESSKQNNLEFADVNSKNMKKNVTSICFSPDGKQFFCATNSGEILVIAVESACLLAVIAGTKTGGQFSDISQINLLGQETDHQSKSISSQNAPLVAVHLKSGVTNLVELDLAKKCARLKGKIESREGCHVTSFVQVSKSSAFALDSHCQLARIDLESGECEVVQEPHAERISSIVFPSLTEEVFVTCGGDRISIFATANLKLRAEIRMRNCTCLAVQISVCGSWLVSGWSDGAVRVFTPQSARLALELPNAHRREVTCLALASGLMVTGGSEGQMRLWSLNLPDQDGVDDNGKEVTQLAMPVMMHTLHSHRAAISSLEVLEGEERCLSSSEDGTCIVWDLKTYSALKVMFYNSMYRAALYEPLTRAQVLTCTSDGTLIFWNESDGMRIREVKSVMGAKSFEQAKGATAVNALSFLAMSEEDCEGDGGEIGVSQNRLQETVERMFAKQRFVTGGADRKVKVWSYDDAEIVASSLEHGDEVTSLAVSAHNKYIVSGCRDGSLYLWKMH